ncbi:hypothetical protein [Cryptosporangium phraense]|uniref:Uncharacterized protein n=1 Tax=Cryptosporangium phraense TaxID=2593070 RepID=A0A545AP15_9ACTN|nr:hypothetical protein [Cryptosporangium phraense]TQS43020.1 hypothetical protein FL583_21535 [Cryptosporangium phraense]
MPDALEVSLAEVLRRAAEAAPEPAGEAGEALLRERARRAEEDPRGRLLVAAAAITVLIVLAAAVTVIRLVTGGEDIRPITPPVRIVHTDYEDGSPIADVWPDAVRTIPGTIPIKGRPTGFGVERILPDGQLVVVPTTDDPDMPHVWTLNPATGKARPVGKYGDHVVVVAQPVDAGETRWVAWIGQPSGNISEDAPVYLWYAPAGGGRARKVLSDPISTSHGVDLSAVRLLISGDTIILSPALKPEKGAVVPAAIRTVRIGEGKVRTLPDSTGRTVLQWPWLSDLRTPGFRSIRNAETGEERPARPPAAWTGVECSLSWCVGQQAGRLAAARRDGSDARPLATGGKIFGIVRDRFLFVSGTTVYDLRTKKTLTLPRPMGRESGGWVPQDVLGAGGGSPAVAWTRYRADTRPEAVILVETQAME